MNGCPLQDYVHEMGACLIQLADSSDDSCVTSWLHKLTSEAMTLIAYRTKIKQLTISPVMNEDVMIKTHDKILVPSMDTAYYRRILVMLIPALSLSSAANCCRM